MASAYLQAWAQQSPSRIVFDGLRARTWSPGSGYSDVATYNADAYVFAVLTASTHDEYDAFDIGRWRFWVLPRGLLEEHGARSMSLSTVPRLVGERWAYSDLEERILRALQATG